MIKNCLVCKNELHRSKQHGKRGSIKKRIGINQVTCGGYCGKTYQRIYLYFTRRNRKRVKEVTNEI